MILKTSARLVKCQFISCKIIQKPLLHNIQPQNFKFTYNTRKHLSTHQLPLKNSPWIQEIADLMTELYILLEKMKYLKPNSIAYPPHVSPSINTTLTTTLGLSPSVTDLLQRLPYVVPTPGPSIDPWTGKGLPSATNWSGHFLLTTTFADMREDNILRACRYVWGEDPQFAEQTEDFRMRRDNPEDEELGNMFLKGHQVALTGYSWISSRPVNDFYPGGGFLILDMETRRLHTVGHGAEPYHEYEDGSYEDRGSIDPITKNQIAPGEEFSNERENRERIELYASRPATEALQDYISRFQTLEWVPGFVEGSGLNGYKRDSYKSLYISHGWPDNFNSTAFEKARISWDSNFAAYERATKPFGELDQAKYEAKQAREAVTAFKKELEEVEAYEANPVGKKPFRGREHVLEGLKNHKEALVKHEKKILEAREKIELVDPVMKKMYFDFREKYPDPGYIGS